jgi:hypothetical protein
MMTKLYYFFAFVISALLGVYAFAADPTGTNTPAGSLVLQTRTFATLPAATAGTVVYIADGATGNCGDSACTTFGTAVTGGGGALKLLIWYNAAGWTLIGK